MRTVASKPPSKEDVDKYIANNPSKFANRKLLSVEQIGFPLGPTSQSVIDANKDAKSLDEIDQQLTSAGIPHSRQMGTLSSGRHSAGFLQRDRSKESGRRILCSRGSKWRVF